MFRKCSRCKDLLLPPLIFSFCLLKCLYKTNVHIQDSERTQPRDSRPVLPPPQHILSGQIMRNWEVWKTNIEKSNNHRMLQQLGFHTQQTIQVTMSDTSVQDLDPRPCADNVHESVLPHEMETIEPGENPTRRLASVPVSVYNPGSDWTWSRVCMQRFSL